MKNIIIKTNERINALKAAKAAELSKLNNIIEQNKEIAKAEAEAMEKAIAATDTAAYSKAKAAKIAAEDIVEVYEARVSALSEGSLVEADEAAAVVKGIQEFAAEENTKALKKMEALLAELSAITENSNAAFNECAHTLRAWNREILGNKDAGAITPKRLGYRITVNKGVERLTDICL